MKLGHPGEIIFTEETLETNSHQCNNLVLGSGPRAESCARQLCLMSTSMECLHGQDRASDGRVSLYLPPQRDKRAVFKVQNRNGLENKKAKETKSS